MKFLGLGHFTFLDLTPVELIQLARRTGFSFVGLRFVPFAPGQLHYCPETAADLRALRSVLSSEGIEVYDIETVVIDEAFEPDTLRPVIDAAASIGAKRLNVCADDWDRGAVVARFQRLCELAGNAGLGVDIECMAWRGIDTPSKCLGLIDGSGAPNAAFLVDALHLDRCGGTVGDVKSMPADRVRSAQLCDAAGSAPTGIEAMIKEARGGRMIPGDGGLDLRSLVAALPSHTVISVEIPMSGDPRPAEARATAIHSATVRLLEHIQ